jgi:hypothetical protein
MSPIRNTEWTIEMNAAIKSCLATAVLLLCGCRSEQPPSQPDLAALQRAVLAKQELLLQIHLDLDSAASEISDAEQNAAAGNCSGAEFHAAQAYQKLQDADEAILDLGRDLQAMFNLDALR